uniref:UDP-N-acetylglucosamine transporter n=1 Tax=Mycena chlorophos TaxID=658473 RepID=A0ABQ0M8B2_MYCCL|nr:UDP-N-acetylglucosamine transporter [Mycena chlorophos]
MSVHIIFRSGGLVVSMLLGWIVVGKKYTFGQVVSVLLVTLGVFLTTLSASTPSSASTTASVTTYIQGIAILALALILSGALGLVQEKTYSRYGHASDIWTEAMFYMHLLALPLFILVRKDIMHQFEAISSGARSTYAIPLPVPARLADDLFGSGSITKGIISLQPASIGSTPALLLAITLPHTYVPLLLNTLTQVICVAGVNRLTTSVSALTVTLILVVRKAMSLFISVLWLSQGAGIDQRLMWTGAGMVLAGTVGYSVFTRRSPRSGRKHDKQKKE